MEKEINAAKKLNTYALIKASWLSDNFISSLEPLIITLINKKLYNQIIVEDLCKDFEIEYGVNLPALPCTRILVELQKKDFIKYFKETKSWSPKLKTCSQVDISSSSSIIYNSYEKLKKDFMNFTKERYGIELTNKEIDIWIDNYVRINSTEIFQGNIKEKNGEVDSIKITADYILFLVNKKSENLELFKKIAIGKLIVDALEFNDAGKNLRKVSYYLDTRIILYLIGFYGEFRKKTYENLLKKLNEKGAHLKIFSHTKKEIMNILTACEKYIDSPNYNIDLSTSSMRYLRSKCLDSSYVREKIVSLERKYDEYFITEDTRSYGDFNEKYQIDTERLEELIKNYYAKNGVIITDNVLETISYDTKSIDLIYYIRENENVQNYDQTKAILLTTNRNLVYASKKFSTEFFDNAIPSCISDVTLGTIVWANSGIEYCDQLIESKLISDCSASMEVSQQSINKFCSFVDKMKNQEILTDVEIVALKSFGLATEAVKPKLYSNQDFEEKDIHEIMAEIKESTILDEKMKHNKELELLNQNISELEVENAKLKEVTLELENIKKIEEDKNEKLKSEILNSKNKFDKIIKLFQIHINFVLNVVVQIILFFISNLHGVVELILRLSIPLISLILVLIIQFDIFNIKTNLCKNYVTRKIAKLNIQEIKKLYGESDSK